MLHGVMTTEEVQRTSDGENAEQFLSILTAENRATRLILAAQTPDDREVLECGAAAPLSNSEEMPEKRHSNGEASRSRGTGSTKRFSVAAEGLRMIHAVYLNASVEPELIFPS